MLFIVVLAIVTFVSILLILPIFSRRNTATLNIKDKYVLITGCDSGFGRETALRLDKMGVCVLATCLTEEGEQSLRSVASEKLKTFQMDVTDPQQIEAVFFKVNQLLEGSSGLWGLVNNAGILTVGPVEWLPLDAYKKVADVNLWGLVDVTKTFLPLIKKAKGRIVIVSSIAGVISPQAFSPYCISKYGVEAFADALRREMRPFEVLVSVIEPGATRTPILNDVLLCARLKQLWDNLSEEKQQEYGKGYLENATKGFRDWCKSASKQVSRVIDAIVLPLTSRSPKKCYVIGQDAWQLKFLSHLPEVLQDFVLREFPFRVVVPSGRDLFEKSSTNGSAH
ncbi:short-chain dehydrogenase/reductase family 9C member 7-like isoform X1 [Stylophora pistillata]|uniref:Retinol dehydrogenase 2 n=1 Tax=Stylophora pistillata TaxID=50429 RepID=A0A2B4S2T4_STYPI|nr:short-chain dehydrogenase/reductase family 9C member 7-like isoform X1 [Stylophora pistillata]PFX24211.1 Retinol dehydrogenase 2 [Stylophora pistillata]